jgi:metal-sulfur cluster biosynthetic enzyme
MTLDDRIADLLDRIHDPCSVAAGRPTSIRALGLVRGWHFEEGVLTVTFCVTFPGCTMAPHFTEAAREALSDLPGVKRVDTVVDTSVEWTPPTRAPMRGEPQAWRSRALPLTARPEQSEA